MDPLYELSLNWITPITIATLYTVSVKWANSYRPREPYAFTRSRWFKWARVVHNLGLALYSAWTFFSSVPIIYRHLTNQNIPRYLRICCPDGKIFDDGMGWYTYLFYLSKYYEVVDTLIILASGKKSPLLQTYHHAGAMITMFAGAKYRATPIWLFVVFNSFIHSIMYANLFLCVTFKLTHCSRYVYYTCATLRLPFPRLLKKSITTLQISQFIIGGGSAALHLIMQPEDATACLPNFGSKLATYLTLAYLTPLTTLFVQFFIREYTDKRRDTAIKVAEAARKSVEKGVLRQS